MHDWVSLSYLQTFATSKHWTICTNDSLLAPRRDTTAQPGQICY